MNTTSSCADTDASVQLTAQIANAKQFLTFPAGILEEAQQRRLMSRVDQVHKDALETYESGVRQIIAALDLQANEAAMKSLLEPRDARHRVRAFFSHAKARAMEFGLLQYQWVVYHCEGSFADLLADVRASQAGCHRAHLVKAAALTREMVGKDPTTEQYAMTRTEAACAQGREEAYSDLTELFDAAMAFVESV